LAMTKREELAMGLTIVGSLVALTALILWLLFSMEPRRTESCQPGLEVPVCLRYHYKMIGGRTFRKVCEDWEVETCPAGGEVVVWRERVNG